VACALGYVPRMDIDVAPIREATDEAVESFGRLLPQLSSSAAPLTRDGLQEILGCPTNTVLVARVGGRMVGALTLVLVPIPTGVRAWIEDVVVDTDTRGLGIGSSLTRAAVRIAEAAGARTVDLTSRPSRVAANRMYERVGFARRDTHVYRYSAEAAPSSAGKGDPSSSASST
jgi:ribosomal protein S18 acetylase RimI-like enzyme